MRLFSEKVNPTFNSSGYNILTVKDYTEVFFDVYEFEINGSRFVAEKTGELDDAPIISIPVDYNNIVENYDFVLHKGEQSIHFDPSTQSTPSQIKSVPDVEPLLTESVEEETDEVFLEEKKSAILEEIEKAKIAAAKYIKSIEKQNKRELVSYQTEREIALKEDIEKQKKILLDEFYSFVDQLKDRIAEESSDTALELKDIISEQLTSVSKDIDTRLSSAEKAIDIKLEERANELLNDVLLSEVKRSGKEIADDLNNQVKTIAENISKSLTSTRKQIEVDINEKLQEISTELNAKDKAIVELNDTLTKQSNRALSRIGTVKTQLESTVQDVVNSLEARIETASDRLEKYYAEKLQLVESSMTNVSEETKKHIIGLIKESHQSLQADIANIKVTVPNIVIEKSNGNQEIDVGALRTELEKSVSNRFVNEISSLKRLIELSSGGGSVAMQFAGGGTMNGNLTVVGTISASQYLGIPGGSATGAYLPLSGGTVTGNVSVSGLLSANRIGFNTGAGLTAGTGQLTWNDVDGTLELGLKGGVVRTEIGQGLVTRVVNKTNPSVDLPLSAYQVVVIGGAQGQRLSVKLAQADNDANSAGTLGIVAENIPKNQEGFVVTVGLLKDRNTTGSLQGETWNDGDILYLSPTVAGGITNIKPQAPQHTVIIGYVEYAHQNNGKIYVKIDNGYELNELHNVRITSVSANDVLKYNGTDGVWENSNTITLSSLSASRIYTTQLDALSANISVIDITRYELSGFNVTGDVTINGSVSASRYLNLPPLNYLPLSGGTVTGNVTINGSVSSQNISAATIYTNGVPVATAVDPVRTTLTGNGVLSTFAISGAANLINPSALIVAIDGALQEPSVDYTVSSGSITFTSPLPSGSKAVVISPTNALVAGQVVPSDGSVTSAKIAGGVSISDPTLIGNPIIQKNNFNTSIITTPTTNRSLTAYNGDGVIPIIQRAIRTTNSALSGGSPSTNDTVLTLPLLSGRTYRVKFYGYFVGTGTPGVQMAAGITCTASSSRVLGTAYRTGANSFHIVTNTTPNSTWSTIGILNTTINQTQTAETHFIITTIGAGNIFLNWQPYAGTGTGTLFAGSYIESELLD